jgi:hypothetical protein
LDTFNAPTLPVRIATPNACGDEAVSVDYSPWTQTHQAPLDDAHRQRRLT